VGCRSLECRPEHYGRRQIVGRRRDAEVGYKVAAGLFKRGVLVAGTLTSAHNIRIEPLLVITYEQIDAVLNQCPTHWPK